MNHRIGGRDQRRYGIGILQRARDPRDAGAGRLRTAGQRANLMPGGQRTVDYMAADESGAAGDREDHSSAMWLRWTSAARGA